MQMGLWYFRIIFGILFVAICNIIYRAFLCEFKLIDDAKAILKSGQKIPIKNIIQLIWIAAITLMLALIYYVLFYHVVVEFFIKKW